MRFRAVNPFNDAVLCYWFQYLPSVGQPGGSGFVVSTGLVSTGVGAVIVVVVLIAVVSTRGGPASCCGRGSGLPRGESGFGPELAFRFEFLRSWAIMLSINARWRALLASA